jgi:hypothetical protein
VLRLTEAEYAAYLRRGTGPAAQAGVIPPLLDSSKQLSEAAFMAAVVRLAKQHGWMVYHTWSSKKSPEGFPDLVCARAGSPLLAIETKTDTGQVTKAQQAWLEALGQCTGVVSEVWRPAMLREVVERLRA